MAQKSTLSLQSSLLTEAGFTHGFFRRTGGVSSGAFDSLNFTEISGDSESHVDENLRRVASELEVRPAQIYFLTQVHGTDDVVVSGEEDRRAIRAKEGDIVFTKRPGVAAAIRTADCVPVLLACVETGWVAACHSGWQGCVKNAAGVSARRMFELGATKLIAAIGPHISLTSFEVSDDVAKELQEASPDPEIVDRTRAKPHVDLRRMVHAQLKEAGLQAGCIDDVLGCTVLDRENYFSFRRDGNPSGRMLSAIVGRSLE